MGLRNWLPWLRAERRELTLDKFRGLGLLDEPTAAGVIVSERNALTLPAYWSGVSLIANAIAKLPRKVYRTAPDGSREEAGQHPVAWLLQVEPNEYATPLVFWRTLIGHVLTWGNGYAEIERDGANRPIGLITVTPDKVVPVIERGVLSYLYDGKIRIPRQDMLHIPGLGFDGVRGYSVVQVAKQSIGLGLALERYGAAFFGNGAFPGLLLEHPAKLSPEASERLRAGWAAMHQGPDRAHRTAVLEEGMKANALSIPAKDAQLIEQREIQVLDVARLLNLNPAFLGKSGERPGGNYEASRLDFLDNTLDPWLVAIEQECNRKLLSPQQRGTHYVEHVRNAILRTDAKTRAEVQKLYIDMGAMDAEYVAKLENLPKPEPKPEPPAAPPPPPPEPEDDPEPDPADQAQRALVIDLAARFVRREAEKARRASRRGPAEFQRWAEEFYAREVGVLAEMLQPAVALRLALAGEDGLRARDLSAELATAYVARSKAELLALRAAELEKQTELLLQRWALHRPVEMADAVAALKVEERDAA